MSVLRDRVHRLASIASVAVLFSACSTMNVGNYCSGSESMESDAKSLAIILGIAPHKLNESPFVMFNSPSLANPDQTLHLNLEPAPMMWPPELDESPCQGVCGAHA
jgi:hypothetical protein